MVTPITKTDVAATAQARRRFALLAMAVSIGVVVSFFVFYVERGEEQSRLQAEFERQAETYIGAIQKGIERNLEVLESIGGLYAASGKVDRDDFRRFVQGPLSRHREIQALSWNERVTHSKRSQFEDSVRQEGYPEFQVKDWLLDGQRVVAIERPEYIVVTYIEPYESNAAALGFNVASNPTRLAALESARDTGEMIATGRITLVQETGNQYGFLILKPIYKTPAVPETVEGRRQNLKGFAVGVFRVGDMVETALENLPEGMVNIQLIDQASPADEGLLYLGQASDSDNPPDVVNPEEVGEEQLKSQGGLYLREPLEIPGRQWSLLVSPSQKFYATQGFREPWVVLAGGLLMTALLSVYLISILRGSIKIQGVASQLSKANEELAEEAIESEQREKALRESEERYRSLVDLSPEAVTVQSKGKFVYINDAGVTLYGAANAEELLGRPVLDLIHPDYRAKVAERMRLVLEQGQRVPTMEAKVLRLDGQVVQIEGQGAQIIYKGKPAILAVLKDITERKRAEEEFKKYSDKLQETVEQRTRELKESQAMLIRAGKMEAIGELAAGIAHELNNPLGAVVGYADMLLERANLDGPSKDYVIRIVKRAEQAAQVVRQLKAFVRPTEMQKHNVDLNQVIEDTIEMLTHQMSLRRIKIATQFDPQTCSVWADHGCLEQVFLNLALNAKDAMAQGGKLNISTRSSKDGLFAEITFVDTGVGIPEENLGKILDPFFTFGKNGHGTGLGLAICQRIVQDHGGHIKVESKLGEGSTFTVVLPRFEGT